MPRPIRDRTAARGDLAALYARLVDRAREFLAESEGRPPIEAELHSQELLHRPFIERVAAADAGEPIEIYAFQLPRDHRAGRDEYQYMLTPDGRLTPAGGEPTTPEDRSTA